MHVKSGGAEVDIETVARSLALISVLAALAVGGYLYMQSAEEAVGPSGAVVQDAATEVAADATLLVARTGIESFLAANGTYAGAPVPTGVTLVGATNVSYCIQIGSGATARHLTSPGTGSPQPGTC